MNVVTSKAFAILVPAVLGLGGAALAVQVFDEYGWTLFLGLPIFVSFLSTYFLSYSRDVRFGSAYLISLLSLLALGAMILVFALDGLVCLLMALPLAMLLAIIGVMLGRQVNLTRRNMTHTTVLLVSLALLFPGLVAFEHSFAKERPERLVSTSQLIHSSPDAVWRGVIAFPPIPDAPRGIFRLGVAYPTSARIDGSGEGATRYCSFSTGDFVEPITTWDEPRRLAFDVIENPSPMKEFTFYDDIRPPHLHDHFVSNRGEFRIENTDEGVVLIGSTWYTHSLAPGWYWGPISDEIIHRIHQRVLTHIKTIAEKS